MIRVPSKLYKIAIFTPSFRGGGAERVSVDLANWLAETGMAVDLIVCDAVGPYLDEVSSEVNLLNINKRHVRGAILYLIRYLRENQPDIVLSMQSHANVVALLARMFSMTNTPLVVSERNSNITENQSKLGFLKNWLKIFCYKKADKVLAVSEELAADLVSKLGLNPNKVHTIYNPINLSKISLKAQEAISHPWLNIKSTKIILSVGRLEPQKDFAILIDAINQVRKYVNCKLLILGEGSLKDELKTKVARDKLNDVVDLIGFQDNPFPWFAAADLFVLSSRHEGMPNVLLQAIGLGIPVVSTDSKTGPREILENGKWGLLSPVGCSDTLAKNIQAALNDQTTVNLIERARDFDHNRVFEMYLDLLISSVRK